MTERKPKLAGYEALVIGIVKQAIIDYSKHKITRNQMKSFVNSDWFKMLTRKLDGPSLLSILDKNLKQYGTCMPFKIVDED